MLQQYKGVSQTPHNVMKVKDEKRQVRDPLEAFSAEHVGCLEWLDRMASAAMSIRVNGFSVEAFEQIAEATRFIDVDMREHNALEEKYLYPLLERHIDGPPGAMRNEHRELWRALNELVKSVKDVEDGKIRGSSIRELVQLTMFVVEHLRNHMVKENNVIFPLAKRLLTPVEYKELAQNMASALTAPSRA